MLLVDYQIYYCTDIELFFRFLTFCPARRVSAIEALKHEWFAEKPKPVEPSMFPTWPAKSEMAKTKRIATEGGESPKAPPGAMGYNKLLVSLSLFAFSLFNSTKVSQNRVSNIVWMLLAALKTSALNSQCRCI